MLTLELVLSIVVQNTQVPEVYFKLSLMNKNIFEISKLVAKQNRKNFLVKVSEPDETYFLLPNGKKEGLDTKIHVTHRKESEYINGLKEGFCRVWVKGKLIREVAYVSDLREGQYKSWYPESGNIREICYYKNDMLEGNYKMWYENGQPAVDCGYSKGFLSGQYKSWYDTGKTRLDYVY